MAGRHGGGALVLELRDIDGEVEVHPLRLFEELLQDKDVCVVIVLQLLGHIRLHDRAETVQDVSHVALGVVVIQQPAAHASPG